jgi:hypothetical protein
MNFSLPKVFPKRQFQPKMVLYFYEKKDTHPDLNSSSAIFTEIITPLENG